MFYTSKTPEDERAELRFVFCFSIENKNPEELPNISFFLSIVIPHRQQKEEALRKRNEEIDHDLRDLIYKQGLNSTLSQTQIQFKNQTCNQTKTI